MTLTPLEIFSILTTIISLVFNFVQWRDGKASKAPLTNSLVGTFNEIKGREDYVYFARNTLFSPNTPHKDVDTLRWEFALFLEGELKALEGFREQLTGVLVSLKPDDKAGAYVFRAKDFGLTEQDKEVRRINYERYRAKLSGSANESPPFVQDAPQENQGTGGANA